MGTASLPACSSREPSWRVWKVAQPAAVFQTGPSSWALLPLGCTTNTLEEDLGGRQGRGCSREHGGLRDRTQHHQEGPRQGPVSN